jgi:hypothetical protein
MELLTAVRDKHRTRFTNRINVDLHSAGGWSPEFWTQAEVSAGLGRVRCVNSVTYIVSNPTGRTVPAAYHHTSPNLGRVTILLICTRIPRPALRAQQATLLL